MEKKGFPFKKCYYTLYKSLQSDIRSGRRGFPKFTKLLWNEVWIIIWASLVAQMLKNLPAMQETQVGSLDWEDPLKKGMATHSSILAWRIPWAEEPGGLQSLGSQRVGQD